ncbi:MAG TPA: alpha/beta hydrolase fold domain-containing protein, partial [Pilimelia sp.]|nr:alpha/beta hydrolase fold domain-containing protein [Pilimelia sp.]
MEADPRSVLTRPAPPPDATLAYGPLPDQVADLRLPAVTGPARSVAPAGRGGAPLVLVVHGGFWRSEYDRSHVGPMAADLAARGWPVAVVEYRRTGTPGGGWPGTFQDVAEALARVPDLVAGECAARGVPGPAPGGPVVVGHSAGGHLALWLAATAPRRLRGVLALAPVADLAAAHELDLDGGAVAALLGGGPADVPDRYAAADPAARVRA